jgi:hypothetical protein
MNHAMDVTVWDSPRLSILTPDAALTAALAALDGLPPGHYQIGFLRNPYPTGSDARTVTQWTSYHAGILSSLFDQSHPGSLTNGVRVEDYHKFYHFTANTISPCNAAAEAKRTGTPLPADAYTDEMPPGSTCPTNYTVFDELKWIKDPVYRAKLVAAVKRAKLRNVTIDGTYGDALDHMHLTVTQAFDPPKLRAYDFDRDGRADIPWNNTATGETTLWTMNGSTRKADNPLQNAPLGWSLIGAGDYDGDLKNDLFWYDGNSGKRSIWLMNGTSFRVTQDFAAPPSFAQGTVPFRVGDFNDDGVPDVLTLLGDTTNGVGVGLETIDGRPIGGGLPLITDSFDPGGVWDMNGDGHQDIVLYNLDTGALRVWYLDGRGNLIGTDDLASGNVSGDELRPCFIADFNNDGKPDLLFRNLTTGANLVRPLSAPSTSFEITPYVPDKNWLIAGD